MNLYIYLSIEEERMLNSYIKKCLIFPEIRKKQIKTTLWFKITTVTMAIIKETNNMLVKRNYYYCW
jgi:hypothetical protein